MVIGNFENKRLFIAVELPVSVRKTVHQLGCRVLANCNDPRPVKAANIHITLKFLGNVPGDDLDQINEAISIAISPFNIFSFVIDGNIDAFPNKKRARTIFMAIGEGRLELKRLYLSLEECLGRICKGFDIKRSPNDFMAHITIARLRHTQDITNAIKKAGTIMPIRIECGKIALFESALDPAGVRYTKLREFSIKA